MPDPPRRRPNTTKASAPPAAPAPAAPFPSPEGDLVTRDEIVTYARQILNHVVPRGQIRGCGTLEEWDHRVPAASLSEKTRAALNVGVGVQISLEEIRSWDPGMKIGSRYHQGPGKDDQNWVVKMSWPKFNRALIEIFCVMYGREVMDKFKDNTPRKGPKSKPTAAHEKNFASKPAPVPTSPSPFSVPPMKVTSNVVARPIQSGDGVLSICLSSWLKNYPQLTLSEIPLDNSSHPRLQVMFFPNLCSQ